MRQPAVLIAIAGTAVLAAHGHAQQPPAPWPGAIGQPRAIEWSAFASAGRDGHAFATAGFGARRDLFNPLMGVAGVNGEFYVRAGDRTVPGGRARLVSPLLRAGIGVDYLDRDGFALAVSAVHPLRRGGVFRDGSTVRLDYVPARGSVALGIEKPVLARTPPGRGRPPHDRVRLPPGPAGAARIGDAGDLDPSLAELRRRAHRVRELTLPLGPVPARGGPDAAAALDDVRPLLAAAGGGLIDVEAEVRGYHSSLDAAFTVASGSAETGRRLAQAAKRSLMMEVLLPYNRLLGQRKDPDDVRGLGQRALAAFDAELVHAELLGAELMGAGPAGADLMGAAGLADRVRERSRHVFRQLIDILEENRASARAQWRDSRFVWLPLQLALLPEEHDTQAELDRIIELATGTQFTDGNFVSYLVNEQFQYHLSRTIREAEQYHVLWTHDFRGIDAGGGIDEMSYRHVLHSYLAALTERVRSYDRTGVLPTYMIIIDQWFYEVNRARLWLTLLEDPLHHEMTLPQEYRAWQDSIASAQQALRAAIAASPRLQAEARRNGDAWLRNLVRVHVNVTNPADPTFWSSRVVRGIPLPDNMMRDHRKVAFYDLTEEDPYRGEAIFTGAGIGEHYANLSWEDRSLLVRGPALLPLKPITRELLASHGITPRRMPAGLLPRERAADYDERVRLAIERNDQPLRALQLHNGAGFNDKQVNVAKAVLYTLMPAGSVLKIPDSLWNSDFWTSALLGCALRGGRVLIIAPAAANAPADAFGTLGRSREVLGRLLTAQAALQESIDASGGLLRVGLFRSDQPVTDIPGKVRLVRRAFEEEAWLRDLFSLSPGVAAELAVLATEIEHLSMAPEASDEFEYDPAPKLHLKANFMASREAWTLMSRPEWAAAAWAYMQTRIAQIQERAAAVRTFATVHEAIADVGSGMVHTWHESLAEPVRERAIFYTLMGSHNQNSRSIVIDAEVGFLMSGWPAIVPQIDLIVLVGQTIWVADEASLAPHLPLDSGWRRGLAQWFRLAL